MEDVKFSCPACHAPLVYRHRLKTGKVFLLCPRCGEPIQFVTHPEPPTEEVTHV